MWIPRRLTYRPTPRTILAAVMSVVVSAIGLVAIAPASAGPARGMCTMDTSRGSVPQSFPIDACIDAANVYLRDRLTVPVHLATSGNVGTAVVVARNLELAASITRSHFNDKLLLIPGDTIRVPFGAAAASVAVKDTDAGGFYVLAETVATFIPAGAGVEIIDALGSFVTELTDDFGQYADCLVGKNWIGQLGCRALFQRNVTFALGRGGVKVILAVVKGGVTAILNVLLAAKTFMDFTGQQVPDVTTVVNAIRQGHNKISIVAKPSGGHPKVVLAKGNEAWSNPARDRGYFYNITLTGFAPNAKITISCRNSTSPNGFQQWVQTTNNSGGATVAEECPTARGPDHWVLANGIESNHVGWNGVLPSLKITIGRGNPGSGYPPPPKGASTKGYWYYFDTEGAPLRLKLTCRDSPRPGGFATVTVETGEFGTAAGHLACYSDISGDHWVTGGGLESNHVTW